MMLSKILVAYMALFTGCTAAIGGSPIAVRVLPTSTFTDNPCNAPCQCIIDPIPRPIGGRLTFAIAPSIPEVSVMQGPFRFVDRQFPELRLEGRAEFATNFDPAFLSRLTLDTSYGQSSWLIDSGFFTPTTEFPTLSINLVTTQLDCTTLHIRLNVAQTCVADFDDGSGRGIPDDAVTVDDLLFYAISFGNGDPIADIESTFGDGVPDQAVTIDDLVAFLVHFESGC